MDHGCQSDESMDFANVPKPWVHDDLPEMVMTNSLRTETSPFPLGKSSVSMAIFNSYVDLPEGILSPSLLPTRAFKATGGVSDCRGVNSTTF